MECLDIGSSKKQAYRRIPSVNSDGGLRKSADKLRKQKGRKTGTLDTRGVVHEVQSDCPEYLNFEVSLGPAQILLCRDGQKLAPRLGFPRTLDVDCEPPR